MKRIIISIVVAISMIFSVQSFAMSAHADDVGGDTIQKIWDIWNYINNKLGYGIDDVVNKVNNLDIEGKSKKGVDSYFKDQKTTADMEQEINKNFGGSMSPAQMWVSMANDQWKRVGKALEKGGDLSGTDAFNRNFQIDTITKSNDLINVFKTVGYSLVLIFFSITLIESSIKYEIFTLKGGAMIFGRLLISKTLIDKSVQICVWILDTATGIISNLINSMKINDFQVLPNVSFGLAEKSDLWVIGALIDVIMSFLLMLPVILIALLTIICSGMVVCKLVFRSFELAMLVLVSPAFFACASAEVTKPYFKNFITTFAQCALQIVFMAVVWIIAVKWQSNIFTFNEPTDIASYIKNIAPNLLTLISLTIIMIKPPKVLTGLLK